MTLINRRTAVLSGLASTAGLASGTALLAAPQQRQYQETVIPVSGGRVRGTIRYDGPDIPPQQIPVTKDHEICGEGLRTTNPLRMSEDRLLADCVVHVHGMESGKPWDQEFREAKIYQIDCGFQPRVQIVWEKADVWVVNVDPILHNIHAYEVFQKTRRAMFSFSQPRLGQEDRIPLRLRRSNLINLDCNAHGWMEGWIYTSPTPYFAVTGSDGAFDIDGIPPGQFEFSIWHPVLGEKRGSLTINENDDLNYDLVLS